MDVEIRVPPPLRFLLPARDRAGGRRRLRHDPEATVGHLVQAAGVPLTEVGELRVDGVAAAADDRTGPGAAIDVQEVPRPEPGPPEGFLLDVGLGSLARRLRLLGIDAAWSADADDPDLADRAAGEGRVLLTQDRGLLKRRVFGPGGPGRGALVRGAGTAEQLADVLDRFTLVLAPLTRCAACGGVVTAVPKGRVADRLEPGTRRSYAEFARCTTCGQVYWRGAHARRIDALVQEAAARTR